MGDKWENEISLMPSRSRNAVHFIANDFTIDNCEYHIDKKSKFKTITQRLSFDNAGEVLNPNDEQMMKNSHYGQSKRDTVHNLNAISDNMLLEQKFIKRPTSTSNGFGDMGDGDGNSLLKNSISDSNTSKPNVENNIEDLPYYNIYRNDNDCDINPRTHHSCDYSVTGSLTNLIDDTIGLPSTTMTSTAVAMNSSKHNINNINAYLNNSGIACNLYKKIQSSVPHQLKTKLDVCKNSPYASSLLTKQINTKKILKPQISRVIKKSTYCVGCFEQLHFLQSKDTMSRLSGKEPLSLSSSIETDRFEKKKPFSRPFNKSKLDSSASARMSSPSPSETTTLMRLNNELRNRLQDEANSYRRRLDTYKQAQQNQATLVSRLQAKVLQYKQRCSELEGQIHEPPPPLQTSSTYSSPPRNAAITKDSLSQPASTAIIALPPPASLQSIGSTCPGANAPISLPYSSCLDQPQSLRDYRDDSSDIVRKLEEERQRCDQLLNHNHILRQQLEESHRTNEALTTDLQKLTNDWEVMRDEMVAKEDEWKDEEQAFNDYYNSEHNRLLKMWYDVVSVKRMFKDMQSSLKTELNRMRGDISCANREVSNACNGLMQTFKSTTKLDEQQQMLIERDNMDLKTQLNTIKIQFENTKMDITQREQKVQALVQDLKTMEERCSQAENQAGQAQRLNDEIERLHNALRDIAHAVVQDADSSGIIETETLSQHLHLSQSGIIPPPRSPKRGQVRTTQAFAESTISAVQAALHKYQLLIHDLQVKLQTNNDALIITKKQHEASESTRELLTKKLQELTEKLDTTNYQLSELFKERDNLQKLLDNTKNDKQTVERSKCELSSIVDSLNLDYEKLQNYNSKLQKNNDALDEEKKLVEMELQRSYKDKEMIEMNLRAEEERSSRLREESITLREELNKVYLYRDLLEQQRLETESMLNVVEKQKAELEYDLEKINAEKLEMKDMLEKSGSSHESLAEDVKLMKSSITELEEERNKLKNQTIDQTADIASLKKELITAEQIRLDMVSEKLQLNEKIKFIEIDKEKIEQELGQVIRERSDLSNQLTVVTRKKETCGEELMRLKQRLEQTIETNNRVNRNLEDLIKENEEKQVIIEGHEKDFQRLQELLASIRSEKEALEATLFDTNTTLEATDIKKQQLEHDVQDLLIKQESLKNHVARLTKDLENSERRAQDIKQQLTNAANNQEADFIQKISNLKLLSEENIKKLTEEREHIKINLEKRLHQSVQALETNKNNEIDNLKQQYDTIQMHLDALCQQHEEILIRAENDKQQSLLIAHRDKQAVMEKLEIIARELKNEQDNSERLKRDNIIRCEKDRSSINQLREEISKYKIKLEENRQRSEEELNKLEGFINTLREERENAQKENEELRVQIRLAEDRGDSLNLQLQDTLRKLKEYENGLESIRKELTDTRRSLADSNIERDKYVTTNKELREHVKRVEGMRREQTRTFEEALQKISNLEEIKAALEQEKLKILNVLKDTEHKMSKVSLELNTTQNDVQKLKSCANQKDDLEKELQARMNNEMEERERVQQELHQVKKQLSDLDTNLHATRQELGRARCKSSQDEHRFHNREQELVQRMDEGRCREKRLEDQKHNLEVCLADATQQIQELKARLGGSEGRVRALDEQLILLESMKKDVETKLSSVVHTLRRIAGIQLDGSVNLPYRLLSPSRRYSPARGGHDYHESRSVASEIPIIDVDPEMVRKGVRSLMQQVAQIEREKDDFKSQLTTAKKQYQEITDLQTRSDNKISKLQQALRSCQEEKTNLESKLSQKINAYQTVDETLKQKSDELISLREKFTALELALGTGAEERGQFEDRLEKSRQTIMKLESEKRHLQDELARCEGRASKLDLQRVALEGDIQRLQMALQEKENNLRNLQERLDNQGRASTQLEDRCVALKTTVDQLKERLQSSAITETELRAEINCLHRERSEQGHSVLAGQDKLKMIQKTLSNTDNERRVLTERLESSQQTINELRRNQQMQQDALTRQQEQLGELEVQKSSLESQLRIAKWNTSTGIENQEQQLQQNTGNDDLSRQLLNMQREKIDLRNKLDLLNEKVRHYESEKRGGIGGGSKFSGHVQFDRSEKNLYSDCLTSTGQGEMDSNRLETDSSIGRGGGIGHLSLNTTNYNCGLDHSQIEHENRELRMKVRRLETLLAEKEAELARAKTKLLDTPKCLTGDAERYRNSQIQAERLLDAREQSHRQQVLRLENQISMLREQLAQEAKRRQHYILRSTRAGREMQQLRQTLGDSLRHVAQDPIDPMLLENETRRLDSAVTLSLPPNSGRDYDRSLSPHLK